MDSQTLGNLGLFMFLISMAIYVMVIPNTHWVETPILVSLAMPIGMVGAVLAIYGHLGNDAYKNIMRLMR